MTLEKIISGGQTGADQAGLWIATRAGIKTGGWAPKGWRTNTGPNTDLALYGMREAPSPDYAERTRLNVRDSHGTLRIARDFESPGERATWHAVQEFRRPCFDVREGNPPEPRAAADWLRANNVRILNVAGNAEETAPGIDNFAQGYLAKVLHEMGHSTHLVPIMISASQIGDYLRCGRYYWYARVLGLPEPPSRAQEIGTAFHSVIERWFEGAEPFPEGWDKEKGLNLYPVEVDMIRRLFEDAIQVKPRELAQKTAAVIVRAPGQEIEVPFYADILPSTLELPAVRITGKIDIHTFEGPVDNKTTKNLNYVLTEKELQNNTQLAIYGRVFLDDRRDKGLPDPPTVLFRHNYFAKELGISDFVETRVTPAAIDATWETLKVAAHGIRMLRQQKPRDIQSPNGFIVDDVHAAEIEKTIVPAETDKFKVLNGRGKRSPCAAYGGCNFREVCGGVRSFVEHRNITNVLISNASQGNMVQTNASTAGAVNGSGAVSPGTGVSRVTLNVFAGRMAAANGAGATMAPAPPSPAAAPTQAPAPTPPVVPPASTVAPSAPVAAPAPARHVLQGAPPWTRSDCTACGGMKFIPTDPLANTGMSLQGGVCLICRNRQQKTGGVNPDHFHTAFSSGEFSWECKAEHMEAVAALTQSIAGSLRAPWVVLPSSAASTAPTPPTPPTPPQAAPAPPQAAPAPPQAAPAPVIALPSSPAPAPSTPPAAAGAAPEAPKKAKPVKFTLCVNCVPTGPGNDRVRLDTIFQTLTYELVDHLNASRPEGQKYSSYYAIPATDRWDLMASSVASFLAAEASTDEKLRRFKLNNKYVIADQSTQDMKVFVNALRPHADEVIEALQR